LDRLATAKLAAVADEAIAAGWKWAVPSLDHPPAQGLRRVYPRTRELPPEDEARLADLASEYDGLVEGLEDEEDPGVVQKLEALDAELAALSEPRSAYDPEDIARAGVFVVLGPDGVPRIEAGFIRPEDEAPAPADKPDPSPAELPEQADEDDEPTGPAILPDRLVADLTAHRTAALRHALGEDPDIALAAVVHVLALQCFDFDYGFGSCLGLRLESVHLGAHGAGVAQSPAGRKLEARHVAWAAELPRTAPELWVHVMAMPQKQRLRLLAHCAAMSVNAVQTQGRRGRALDNADALATGVALDMADYWTPTVETYLGRVTKANILEAVAEGVSTEAVRQIEGLKKEPMAARAESLLNGRRWLPRLLRPPEAGHSES
jgi:ParB family chromosome partitioning protein